MDPPPAQEAKSGPWARAGGPVLAREEGSLSRNSPRAPIPPQPASLGPFRGRGAVGSRRSRLRPSS